MESALSAGWRSHPGAGQYLFHLLSGFPHEIPGRQEQDPDHASADRASASPNPEFHIQLFVPPGALPDFSLFSHSYNFHPARLSACAPAEQPLICGPVFFRILPAKDSPTEKARKKSPRSLHASFSSILPVYRSQFLTVRGNGITSRILDIPVRYITQRSKPSPKPEWRAEPYLRRSR